MNYYEILCVDRNASHDEIKSSYRKLAKKYHPDFNGNAEKFKLINEAYQVLSSEKQRSKYNKSISILNTYSTDTLNMNSIFSNYALDKSRFSKNIKADMEYKINISFFDSITGVDDYSTDIIYKKECFKCAGKGGKPITCLTCNGTGKITNNDGFISINNPCEVCNSRGYTLESKCDSCSGSGYNEIMETIILDIPEGITNNTRLLLRNKGNYVNGHRGNLVILVTVDEDDNFSRDKNDIILNLEVTALQILRKEIIHVTFLDKKYEIDLSGAFCGKNFKFSNSGIKSISSDSFGDFIVKLLVKFDDLTEKQIFLLKNI